MRRALAFLIAAGLASALVACSGSTESAPNSSPPAETNTVDQADGGAGDFEMAQVPAGGPTAVSEFPIPAGSSTTEVMLDEVAWSFNLNGVSIDEAVAFYNETLPGLGYTTKENVKSLGFDVQLGFTGPINGFVKDGGSLGVMVTISEKEDLWQ